MVLSPTAAVSALAQFWRRYRYPELFRATSSGERFFLSAIGHGNRVLVFVTDGGLDRLCHGRHLFIDGTFNVCPRLYWQLLTIHLMVENKCVPVVYALMERKSRQMYVDLFCCLMNKEATSGLAIQVKIKTTDLKSGLIHAIAEEFPTVAHKGCFFHFG